MHLKRIQLESYVKPTAANHAVDRVTPSALLVILSLNFVQTAQAFDYIESGRLCLKQGNTKQAMEYFNAELKFGRKTAAAHFGLAQTYYSLHHPADSIKELQLAIQVDPKGPIGVQARSALAKIHSISDNSKIQPIYNAQTSRAPTTSSACPPGKDQESKNAALIAVTNTNNKPSLTASSTTPQTSLKARLHPYFSPHYTEGHWQWFARTDREHEKWLADRTREWHDHIDTYYADAQKCADGSPDRNYLMGRVRDCAVSLEFDIAEIESSYLQEIDKINANADEVFKKSDAGKKFASTHPESNILAEGLKRHRALVAELNTQIEAIRRNTNCEKSHLEVEKANAIKAMPNVDESSHVKNEYNEKMALLDTNMRIAMLALRRQYDVKLRKLDDTFRNLDKTYKTNREQTAKLIPSGQTNLYSRSYETLGDPSGNPIQIIAEPRALEMPKQSTKSSAYQK